MKQKISFYKKILICLVLILLSITVFPIKTINAEIEITDISTAEDLIEFAKNCRVDSYSKNKVFNITKDIDLKGKKFKGIPVFAGKLNGNDHTIKNLNIKSDEIEIGFIGTLTETGIVSSLNIEGTLKADGIVRGIGGIAAANFGTITNCTFNGTIENTTYLTNTPAEQLTGGITAKNFSTGIISLCKSYGNIKGIKNTGGIVGENIGQIIGCENYSSVNTNAKDRGGSIFKDLKFGSINDIKNLFSFKKLYSCENTGGIAGYSTGDIYSSNNKGIIGNTNNGYNVGGIVGKSTGYIECCNNTGEIYGNSNIGGICGQLEPGVIVKYTDNLISKAEGDVDKLFSLVDNTLDDSSTSFSTVSSNVNNLFSNINKISKSASQIETIVSNIADDKFEEIGQIKDVLIDGIQTITTGVETIGGDTTKLSKDIAGGINSILDIGEDISAILFPGSIEQEEVDYKVKISNPEFIDLIYTDETGNIVSGYESYVGNTELKLCRNGKVIKTAKLNLSETQENGVTLEKIDDHTWMITFKVENVSDTGEPNYYYPEINDGNSPYMMYYRDIDVDCDYCFHFFSHYGESGGRETPTKKIIIDEINWDPNNDDAPDKYTIYISDGVLIGKSVVNKGDNSVTFDKIQDTSNSNFIFAAKPYDDDVNTDTLGGTPDNKFSKFESTFTYKSGDDNSSTYKLDIKNTGGTSWGTETLIKLFFTAGAVTSDVLQAVESFRGATSSMTDVSKHLTETMNKFNSESLPAIRKINLFKGISTELDGKIDEFSNYLIGVSNSLSAINISLNDTQGTVISGIKSVLDQANVMADSVFETIYNAKDYISSILSDESSEISNEDYLDIYRGIIDSCNNYADIEGKIYVGGIAGSMSLSGIPVLTEENADESFGLPAISYRAVIRNTTNNSNIEAKDGYAGLICGKQDFGAVVSCIANGEVHNNGNYTGGIVGQTHGLINNCAFKGSLKGKDYIGGIAGATSVKDLLVAESSLSNNYVNLKLEKHNKFVGAIAGNYAGLFKNNYYYCNETEGINTYALEGEYEPKSLSVIDNKTVINSDTCFIKYIASGNVVDEFEVTKGTTISNSLVPSVPKKPCFIGFWFNKNFLNIRDDQTVVAIYIPHPLIIILIISLFIFIGYLFKKYDIKNYINSKTNIKNFINKNFKKSN